MNIIRELQKLIRKVRTLETSSGSGGSGGAGGYQQYVALVTYDGDEVLATVFENTLGVELTWERVSTGKYRANHVFDISKVFISGFGHTAASVTMPISWSAIGDYSFTVWIEPTTQKLQLEVYDASYAYADILTSALKLPIEIRVYP